ncbi:hypothetical protein AB1N83_003037 [Pleurotus pulmonarius]
MRYWEGARKLPWTAQSCSRRLSPPESLSPYPPDIAPTYTHSPCLQPSTTAGFVKIRNSLYELPAIVAMLISTYCPLPCPRSSRILQNLSASFPRPAAFSKPSSHRRHSRHHSPCHFSHIWQVTTGTHGEPMLDRNSTLSCFGLQWFSFPRSQKGKAGNPTPTSMD